MGDLNDCETKKRPLFINEKGKPITRKIKEIPGMMTDLIMKEEAEKKNKKEPRRPPSKPKGALTKKERMKQELMGELGMAFDAGASQVGPEVDEESEYRKTLQQYGNQTVQQMITRSKLPPETDLTLREFCDLVWRAGQASPLDVDEPAKKTEDAPDYSE